MLKLTAYISIFGYLLTPPAFAQQQFFYPLPQTASKPATSKPATSNPWGLKPLSKLPATKPALQPAQQYKPPYYPPTSPSQFNPYPSTNQNYATPSPTPPASTSDVWSSWKNNGGAFRYSPGVDFSTTYGDVVVAVNSLGTAKVKTIASTGTSSWVTLAQPFTGDVIESRPAVVVGYGTFQVFVITALGNFYRLTTPGSLPLSQLMIGGWTSIGTNAINNPAAVLLGGSYFVFGIQAGSRQMFYGTDAASSWTIPLDNTKTFIFSPAAATYMNNGLAHVVVAGVTYDGILNVYDSTAAPTVGQLNTAIFAPSDVACIDSPQAVGLGDRVEIYCRGKDMQFYCVTVMQGGVGDSRILPEADLPDEFKPVYNQMTYAVTIYSKTPAGRIISKPFQNSNPVNYWK